MYLIFQTLIKCLLYARHFPFKTQFRVWSLKEIKSLLSDHWAAEPGSHLYLLIPSPLLFYYIMLSVSDTEADLRLEEWLTLWEEAL